MMIQGIPQADQFKEHLRYALQQETLDSPATMYARNTHIYQRGDSDGLVYYIDSGQVKLHILSPEERGCLLTIHAPGDILESSVSPAQIRGWRPLPPWSKL
jgi:CRP-like cAMP-binding protein